jgi:glycogen operon protein
LLLVLNAHHDVVEFELPAVTDGDSWRCLVDTNVPERIEDSPHVFGDKYEVTGRSFLMFVLERAGKSTRSGRAGTGALLEIAEHPIGLEL